MNKQEIKVGQRVRDADLDKYHTGKVISLNPVIVNYGYAKIKYEEKCLKYLTLIKEKV